MSYLDICYFIYEILRCGLLYSYIYLFNKTTHGTNTISHEISLISFLLVTYYT